MLRVQQRRPLHRDATGRADVPRRLSPRTSYIGGRIQTVDLDDRQGHRPLHRVRRADRCWAPERPGVRRPRRLLLHRPRPRPTTRSGSHHLIGHLLRQGRRLGRSTRSSSRPTIRTASACRPTARSCTGPRPGRGASCNATSWRRASSPRPASSTRRQCLYGFSGLPAARLAGGRRRRQRVRGDARQRRRHRSSRPPGELVDFVADRRHPHHQHLLRRRRPDDGLHHDLDDGEAGEDDVAACLAPSSTT